MMRHSQTHNRQGLGRALTGGMPPHCEDVSVVRGLLHPITQGRQPEADYSEVALPLFCPALRLAYEP